MEVAFAGVRPPPWLERIFPRGSKVRRASFGLKFVEEEGMGVRRVSRGQGNWDRIRGLFQNGGHREGKGGDEGGVAGGRRGQGHREDNQLKVSKRGEERRARRRLRVT